MEKAGVFIITGKQGAGKTTRLMETVELLKAKTPGLFGFYASGDWAHGFRKRFRIVDIHSGESHLLCARQNAAAQPKRNFVFYSDALQAGKEILLSGVKRNGSVAVLDEIGRYELEGKVWHDTLQYLLQQQLVVLFTVRESLLPEVLHNFGIKHPHIFTLDVPPEEIARAIDKEVKQPGIEKGGKR